MILKWATHLALIAGLPVQLCEAAHGGFLQCSCPPLLLLEASAGVTHIKTTRTKKRLANLLHGNNGWICTYASKTQ